MKSMTLRRCDHTERALTAALLALVGLAVWREMGKPRDQRRWHGLLFGWLPYDFRRPTEQRIRAAAWAPSNPHLMLPRAFGIGWDVNVGRIMALLRGRRRG